MFSAEWLFQNHWDHIAMAKLLEIQLDTDVSLIPMTEKERDEEIAALVLSRPALDGLPKAHGFRCNSTERAVLALENHQDSLYANALKKQLTVFRYLLKVFDSLMSIIDCSEQRFILLYYGKHLSLSRMTEEPDSPVYGLSKTTVWNYKHKLMVKCDILLQRLCPTLT